MNVRATDHPLKALKAELAWTLQRVQLALESYLENPVELEDLESVASLVDQIRTAFLSLDQPQAASLMEEADAVARALLQGALDEPESAQEALLQALLQTPRYLEWLQRDGKKPSFELLPLTNQLRRVRGLPPRNSGEIDLILPAGNHQRSIPTLSTLASRLRPELQRALLGILRDHAHVSNLKRIADIFGQLKRATTDESAYRFWWLAEGTIQKACAGGNAPGQEINLLRDLDRHVKQLIETSSFSYDNDEAVQELTQRLTKRLFGSEAGLRQIEARPDYKPPKTASGVVPSSIGEGPAIVDISTLLRIADFLRESLASIKDAIDRFAQDDARRTDILQSPVERLHDLSNILALLNMDVCAELIQRHTAILAGWITATSDTTEESIFQLAGELLLVESSLEDVIELANGETMATPTATALEHSDRLTLLQDREHRRARTSVIRAMIHVIEETRELRHGNDEGLVWNRFQALAQNLNSIFTLLECDPVSGLASCLSELLEAPGAVQAARGNAHFIKTLTGFMVTLEYYLELLGDDEEPANDILDRAENQLRLLESMVVHGHVPQGRPENAASIPPMPDITTFSQASSTNFESLESLPEQKSSISNLEIISEASSAEGEGVSFFDENTAPLPPINTNEFKRLAERIESINAHVQPEITPDSAAEAVDPEIVKVFFEEARSELASIHENLAAWRQDPDNQIALSAIRRSFHTLKGSGRMVEEFTISELAWCFEKLLNAVLEGELTASPEIMAAIERVQSALASIVGESTDNCREPPDLATLAEYADTLLSLKAPADIDTVDLADGGIGTGEPLPQLTVTPDAPVSGPANVISMLTEQDQDLLELFLSEAAEILDASETTLHRWSTDRENLELLNDFRREMHTLKGSSRMTGFMTIGDLAHTVESLLDAIATNVTVASSAAVDVLQRSLDSLTDTMARVRVGAEIKPAEDLIHDIHDLLGAKTTTSEKNLPSVPAAYEKGSEWVGSTDTTAAINLVHTGSPVSSSSRSFIEPDQELMEVFLEEAAETLNASDMMLQRLSADRDDTELLNDLRRQMHTLKGSSRMTGFSTISDLAHAMESLLDAIANGTLVISPPIVDNLQRALDGLNGMMTQVKDKAEITPAEDLIYEFSRLLDTKPAPPLVQSKAGPQEQQLKSTTRPNLTIGAEDTIRVSTALLNNLINQMGESSIYRARIDQGVGALRFSLTELEQTVSRLRQQLRRLEIETEAQILFRYEEDSTGYNEDFDPLELDRFSELQQLSRSLMEIVDDLNNIQNTLEDQSQDMTFLLDQQAKINKEIQQGLMQTRMVRFSSVVPRLRRVVRQVALELGKRADLILEGSEAEVDRTVLENMVAPLEHMLRNSVAHGIELPDERHALGKPECGKIELTLCREGAELVIKLGDDGAGIDFKAIRTKGEADGLLPPDREANEQELIALLLSPGFSTASRVTQIAGRGVGMDVLNDAVKDMHGALQIQSQRGLGTNFTIRLPFSLAVTQALLIEVSGETYAIPLLSIEAVTRLAAGEMKAYMSGETVEHKYSDHRYPVHSLGIVFGSDVFTCYENLAQMRPPALLFRSAEAIAALQVDAVLGNQEIIVKPVGPQLRAIPGISGATVLGDGRVIVVLELAALVRNLSSQDQRRAAARALRITRQRLQRGGTSAMVIDDSITMRKVMARFLERHSINVTTAKDGLEAVALLEEQAPDLVILDIEMPRMDGFEVVAHIRNQDHLKDIPIIMVTSRSGEKHRERAFKLGVNDYLIKPYQEEAMMKSIRRILHQQGLRQTALNASLPKESVSL